MFPLQPSDELDCEHSTTSQGENQIWDDLIADRSLMESNIINFSTGNNDRQRGKTTNSAFRRRRTRSRYECNIRKAMHRDTERKRRQEMSNLYVSLRSLLPDLEHAKGRSSVCDEMEEAVAYIKQMQQNIQELRIRRNKLKKLSNVCSSTISNSNGCNELPNCVTVDLAPEGLEVLISHGSDLRLSRLVAELVERELDVVSCVSSQIRGRFFHKIQTEARDMTRLDVSVLQDKLANAIK